MALGSKPEICFPSSSFRLLRYRLAKDGISSERLLKDGRFRSRQPSLAVNLRTSSCAASPQADEKISRTRLARPVSWIRARSSIPLSSVTASRFWKYTVFPAPFSGELSLLNRKSQLFSFISSQFTVTKGLWDRGLLRYRNRAICSFPVPSSPQIITGWRAAAMVRTFRSRIPMAPLTL